MKTLKAMALILAVASANAAGATDDLTVPMTIETSLPGDKIDRHIFGQFAEHLGLGGSRRTWHLTMQFPHALVILAR